MRQPLLLAIDQGTTSTRAILFDRSGAAIAVAQRELPQHFPQPGWVEHDAERIWQDTRACVDELLRSQALPASAITALGITNQRETTVLWDRQTGAPLHPAIVWQDRRTAEACVRYGERISAEALAERTGLLLDPYFSATKLAWLLDHVPDARRRAEAGELAFGTIDSWLLWRLSGGRRHATDASNASRTLLYNLHTGAWDPELLNVFGIPAALLPEILDCADDYGSTDPDLFGAAIPIRALVGDQQAATVGQACFAPGMVKSTYGTGCFMVMNTGEKAVRSQHRLLGTTAYRLQRQTTFALEGSIFVAGAAVQWLRDAMHLIGSAAETEALARSVTDTHGVYLVPAFTGLGAPYWDPLARGAILGLTRDTGIAHVVRAALESTCYQTRDLLEAMAKDAVAPRELRVDGGMAVNNWLMQFLADILGVPVVRPKTVETTALGAALLAGLATGVYGSLDEIAALWQAERRFEPAMSRAEADAGYAGWLAAVTRTRSGA